MPKFEPCPFCGGEAKIIVCDDEGNHHNDGYENDPWSGLGFMLCHDEESNPDCPIAHEVGSQCGRTIYGSRASHFQILRMSFWISRKGYLFLLSLY
jgi:hypothetical protein